MRAGTGELYSVLIVVFQPRFTSLLFLVVFYLHFFVLFVISFPVLSLVFRSFFVSN